MPNLESMGPLGKKIFLLSQHGCYQKTSANLTYNLLIKIVNNVLEMFNSKCLMQ